ncbi:hypothetical protein [Caproiciproducens sp. CPB-2]|uniref:hypothetical protein n=1 Tax=Caproiciproducens sp. CPB-2 TaxID=3030017 RepID=UPI0023D9E1A3|nr:hypothetical protein [Caproiciproducens sp. CPB-2]MDF1494187.1 hypothetical protein [Caproiciproducens sp. CPB-2]
MRDTGKPAVTVHILSGTAGEIARNRENLRYVTEQICSEKSESAVKVTIDWGAPAGKGLISGKGKYP